MAIEAWMYCGIAAIVGCVAYWQLSQSSHRKLPLPPGPKPMPLLGNIKDLPPDGAVEYQHWLKHKDLYGGISSVTVMGMTLVLIHDVAAARDLLDTSSSRTSGRPSMVMANQLCGYEAIAVCQAYGAPFRRYRKLLHRLLGTKASAEQFRDVQEVEVKRQLVRALGRPQEWIEHLKTTTAATVLQMAYGYAIEPDRMDALVQLTYKMMEEFSLAAVPMAWAVDIIPALRYLPDNFLGASFKKTAREWRRSLQATAYLPYRFVRRQMAASTNRPSYVSKLVQQLREEEQKDLSHADEYAVIWSAASLNGAAADTTVITLTAFTLAMVKFPHVQRKAQAEIDRVVGASRLPTFDDREKLPYVAALVKEATRWWPIAPMCFPHTATEDVEYNGLRIPKGAYLLPNVWWFLHDPDVHADPEDFDPERFLPPRNEPDPVDAAFGFGRRICPGRFFADSSMYINIVQSLAVFDFSKAVDKNGREIEVDIKPKPGILMYPNEFDFKITPRSEKHVELIKKAEREHPAEAGDAEHLDSVDDFEIVD